MKLSFSTLGCPDWDLEKVIAKAVEYSYDGIELRGLQQNLDITRLPQFTNMASQTLSRFQDAGIEIACFSSSVFLSQPNPKNEIKSLDEIKRYADLCELFGTKYIRLFGGKIGEKSWEQAIEEAATRSEKIIGILKNRDIKAVIETHDDWMSGVHFRKLMEKVQSKFLGVLWDVNHPFMFINELPEKTWQEMGQWVFHTHWKDSKIAEGSQHGFLPCLMGEGVLPLRDIYRMLKDDGYQGYLSLEYEKRWHSEIPEPEIAFPQYVHYMKKLINEEN